MDDYKFKVNEEFDVQLSTDAIADLDLIELSDGSYHLIQEEKVYRIELVEADYTNKFMVIKVNGTPQRIEIEDQYDQLIQKLGLSVNASQKVNDIKAPMPGLVLDIAVTVGQEVKKGDGLIVLEAMKMENMIKSPGEGKVKAILIDQGAAVDKGQVLIEME
ncbi:MAG: biotin/lipoyl-containing protein [Saprospiraceae bacterium]